MTIPAPLQTAATPTVAQLEAFEPEAQRVYALSIVGRDVREEEVQGLLHLAETGKNWIARMWAIFALRRAGAHDLAVLPRLTALLKARPIEPERLVGTLAETISKMPSAVEHLPLLFEIYRDTGLTTETKSIAGIGIAQVLMNPAVVVPVDVAVGFTGSALVAPESPAGAILRKLIEEHIHDGIVAAAARSLAAHPPQSFSAARSVLEEAARCRHSESIADAGLAALRQLDSVA